MIGMRKSYKSAKHVILIFFTILTLMIPTKYSLADNESTIGFIIEANQMEGTPLGMLLAVGETTDEKARPMLELKFADSSVNGLKIKKLVKTQNGIVTTKIISNEMVHFQTLTLKVSNAEFKDIYVPELGKIGFHDIKLLAHNVETNAANLPQFVLEFETGDTLELQPKNEQELQTIKNTLENLFTPS